MTNSPKINKAELGIRTIGVFALTAIALSFYLGQILTQPNTYAFTFGGDGMTIDYNLQYHATYGEGTHLTSQFYPEGENIFLTDAQGMLAILLSKLRTILPGIEAYAVGFSNILLQWDNCLAALLLFLILIKLKVDKNLSIILAILIALMSPQIHRQTCGHFAMGYAFLIPMVILFILRKGERKQIPLRFLITAMVLILFGLNNPYTLAINCSLLIGCGLFGVVLKLFRDIKLRWADIFSWLLMAFSTLAITFTIISSADFVNDRTKVPAGFFYNQASLSGLLYPSESWWGELITSLTSLTQNSFESRSYLGLAAILALVILIFERKFIKQLISLQPKLLILICSSLLVLLFAFGFPINLFKDFALEHLSLILQFRAPARFSWVFYYVVCIIAAVGINHLWHRKIYNIAWAGKTLAIFMMLIWAAETHEYLTFLTKGKIHESTFSPASLEKRKNICREYNIDTINYQGIYTLPSLQGWTDKFLHEGHWRTNHRACVFSVASGLPLINGRMSRMSMNTALNSLQLVSDPLIKRELLEKLDDRKILFVVSKEVPVELDMEMESVWEHEKFSLKALRPSEIRSQQEAHKAAIDSLPTTSAVYYNHFQEEAVKSFASGSALPLTKGLRLIDSMKIDPLPNDSLYSLSFWYYPDNALYGAPAYHLSIKNSSGTTIHKTTKSVLDATDTQDGWLKINFDVPVDLDSRELILYSEYQFPSVVDELLIRRKDELVRYQDETINITNNIKIK